MSEFKVLSDREHVKIRSGMYCGSIVEEPITGIINYTYQTKTIVPGLIKCFDEILQNSVDEALRVDFALANKISVNIKSTINGTEISVSDNGRGIPVEKIGGRYRPELAWTELRAGSNFDDSKGRITAGSHGMGSSIVNILSEQFVGVTDDGKLRCTVTCTDNMANVDVHVGKSKERGTTVTFIPDLKHFGISEFSQDHTDVIIDRLYNMAIMYPKIEFSINGTKLKFKNIKQIAKNFHESAVSFETENIGMVFAPAGADEEFRCLSYVNGIYVKNGGAHVDYVMGRVIETLREAITKKHKINVLPNQIKQHILFASWINGFKNLKFDSQTKERITNTQGEVSAILGDIDYEKIAKSILNTPEIIDPMIAAILYKKELAEKQALAKANKDLDKTNLRKISKFTDAANKTDRKNCMLAVCEGDSAANAVLSARTEMIGCYPLKGKPINAMGATAKDLLANKEFVDLMLVTGLKIGQKVNSISDLRFGKIVMMVDADADGTHIQGLLCAMIKKFWPELFTLGAVYAFNTPLVKVEVDKKELYFYSLDGFNKWVDSNKSKKFTSRYLKGLGSSTAKDFKKYFENMNKHLVQITIDDVSDLEVVDLVFGKEAGAADKRKVWLDLEQTVDAVL